MGFHRHKHRDTSRPGLLAVLIMLALVGSVVMFHPGAERTLTDALSHLTPR
jgi:hypothetical protein